MPSRRAFLTGLASATLAGCTIGPSSPDATGTPTESQPPTFTSNPTSTPPTNLSGSWTHADADARATKSASASLPDATPERVWSVDLGQGTTPTLLSDDALYTAIAGRLTERDTRTGEVAWQTDFEEANLAAVIEDTLYVTTGGKSPTSHALSTAGPGDGFERWRADGVRVHRATSDIVVTTGSETLQAYAPDGTKRWRVHVDDLAVTAARFESIAVGPDHVFAAAENSGSVAWVYGFDRSTGEVRWHDEGPNHAGMLTVTPELVLSGGFYGGVEAWTHEGTARWKAETTPPVGDIAFERGRVYVSAHAQGSGEEPAYHVLDTDGEVLWTRKQGTTAALTTDATIVDTGRRLAALDANSGGERWTWTHQDAIGHVVPADDCLFVQTGNDRNKKTLHLLA